MTTGYVVNLENGHDGWCVESIPGLTYCGQVYAPSQVEREVYALDRGDDHPHNCLCFDCQSSDSREVRSAARGVSA
ncbi:MAG: hypothetical protein ACOCUO_00875 [archaeon]